MDDDENINLIDKTDRGWIKELEEILEKVKANKFRGVIAVGEIREDSKVRTMIVPVGIGTPHLTELFKFLNEDVKNFLNIEEFKNKIAG